MVNRKMLQAKVLTRFILITNTRELPSAIITPAEKGKIAFYRDSWHIDPSWKQ
jgi:hypothetical protein